MTQEERFNAVMEEAKRIDKGLIKYRDSWSSRLGGDYENQSDREVMCEQRIL